jgi:hypothetical protein
MPGFVGPAAPLRALASPACGRRLPPNLPVPRSSQAPTPRRSEVASFLGFFAFHLALPLPPRQNLQVIPATGRRQDMGSVVHKRRRVNASAACSPRRRFLEGRLAPHGRGCTPAAARSQPRKSSEKGTASSVNYSSFFNRDGPLYRYPLVAATKVDGPNADLSPAAPEPGGGAAIRIRFN